MGSVLQNYVEFAEKLPQFKNGDSGKEWLELPYPVFIEKHFRKYQKYNAFHISWNIGKGQMIGGVDGLVIPTKNMRVKPLPKSRIKFAMFMKKDYFSYIKKKLLEATNGSDS